MFHFIRKLLASNDQMNSNEAKLLRMELESFKNRVEDLYVSVCERHDTLSSKLYKRVAYLETKTRTPLSPKQAMLAAMANKHGLIVQPKEEQEGDGENAEIAEE